MRNVLSVLLLVVLPIAAVTFVSTPTLTQDGTGKLWVAFTISESTDVAVSIVDLRDSTIIRHLVAGKIGSKAPAPLVSNTLQQRIEWDGKDDLGFNVSNPVLLKARVRAGMDVNLRNFTGHNPHSFGGKAGIYGGVFGMVQNSDGSVFICGSPDDIYQAHWKVPYKNVRHFDKDGNYVKTVFPPPSTLNFSQVQNWGAVQYPDANSYTLLHSNTSVPGFSNTLLATIKDPGNGNLLFLDVRGQLVYGNFRRIIAFGQDGSKTDTAKSVSFITNPVLPGIYSPMAFGTSMMSLFPNSSTALVSGIFSGTASSGHLVTALDTGFYVDGRVWRVNLTTGVATVWLDLDSVVGDKALRGAAVSGGEYYAAIHGTAFDAKARAYVCDRLNKRIGVYDSSATLLGQIPLRAPDRVAVGRRTGVIYAVARSQTATGSSSGYVRLFKYSPFDAGAANVCSLSLALTADGTAHLLVDDSGPVTRIWVGTSSIMRIYEDVGTSFSLYKDFNGASANQTQCFDRIGVDRRNETVYFNDSWYNIYKIEDWSTGTIRPCSTSTGERLNGLDFTISPHYQFYVRTGANHYGPIKRYTLDHRHAPIIWANTGNNILTPRINGRYGGGTGERGLAVSTSGIVASMNSEESRNVYQVSFYADSGSRDTSFGAVKIFPLPQNCGGVEFDLKGNLYIGAVTASPEHVRPSVFSNDKSYSVAVGSILRYPAGFDTGSVTTTGLTGTIPKIYSAGFAPFSRDQTAGNCICRSPRFDVDEYGRLFVPDGITCNVSVLDNEGNSIIRFGKYGNADAPAGGNNIPFAYATSAAASEDFIYVSDPGCSRIARIEMVYALDNYPNLRSYPKGDGSVANESTSKSSLNTELSAKPNPFNPATTVTVSLTRSSRIRLDVFSPNGRFITTLASDLLMPGKTHYTWNGTDLSGRPVAPGAYYLRLLAGEQERSQKIVLVK